MEILERETQKAMIQMLSWLFPIVLCIEEKIEAEESDSDEE